ncbi:hypothetical protein BDV95DRAFT_451769, partial [Massariosphaeria phaeospora]
NLTTTSKVLVGPSSTPFDIHTHLLINASPFFRAALTGPFLESTSQSITLPDLHADTFALALSWLYTSHISPVPFKDGKPAYYTLLHLYMLADRLCIEGLRNSVIDVIAALADRTNSVLTPSDTRLLYTALPRTDSPLHSLVLDLFAFKKTDRLLDSHQDRWHAGFLRDLCVRLKRPCEAAMQRHRLVGWCPVDWASVRACEECRGVLGVREGAVRCLGCGAAWCRACVRGGVGVAGWEDGRPGVGVGVGGRRAVGGEDEVFARQREEIDRLAKGGVEGGDARWATGRKWESCKPWRWSRCAIYHEHRETERCGE